MADKGVELKNLTEDAIWIGKTLFERNKTSGSSANMSFMYDNKIYITASGTCFGALTEDSFAVMDLEGHSLNGKKPSKEYPLHLFLYKKEGSEVRAVIHVHSFYGTLWSCLNHEGSEDDVIPHYTPYLEMKVGKVRLIPYGKPGSEDLFGKFKERLGRENGYLLAHHGLIVGDKSLMSAFYAIEECEESAHIAWELRKEKDIKTI